MKYKYYVAVKTGKKTWRYVTAILPHHFAEWKNNKKAKEFSLFMAKDLVFGLTANYFFARIEMYPDFVENIGNNLKKEVPNDNSSKA